MAVLASGWPSSASIVPSVVAGAESTTPRALVAPIVTSVELVPADRRAAFAVTDRSTVATGFSAVTWIVPVATSVIAAGGCGLGEVPRLATAARVRAMSDAARRRRDSIGRVAGASVVEEPCPRADGSRELRLRPRRASRCIAALRSASLGRSDHWDRNTRTRSASRTRGPRCPGRHGSSRPR